MHTCRAFTWKVLVKWKLRQIDIKLFRKFIQEFVGVITDQSQVFPDSSAHD